MSIIGNFVLLGQATDNRHKIVNENAPILFKHDQVTYGTVKGLSVFAQQVYPERTKQPTYDEFIKGLNDTIK